MELANELRACCLSVEAGLVQPGVGLELLDRVAVLAFVGEQFEDQVLEVSAQASAVDLLEVGFNLTGE